MPDLSSEQTSPEAGALTSVCVYCGSSNAADPAFLDAAFEIGGDFARAGLKLVYGGGGLAAGQVGHRRPLQKIMARRDSWTHL